jgi:NADPH:quinone reductase-like Zn-dependent oxidoreductase
MKAVVIDRYGGNEVIEIRDVPCPLPGRHDVLIRVRAASVNPLDWKIRYGKLKLFAGHNFPKILGSECAGEVFETGKEVTRFKKGDQVIGFSNIRRLSAFAEYACTKEETTFSKPRNITFEQASTIPIAGLTALQSLRDLGHVTPGNNVLINGASGGVGMFAVQIGKIFGAKVIAVCSAPNADLVKGLGADRVIDYRQSDFTKSGELYDIIFDAVSTCSPGECKAVLTPKGTYVNTLPAFSIVLNRYLTGLLMKRKLKTVMVRPNISDMEWMKTHIEAGKIRIVIDRVYPMEQIKEALAYSETGKARGKIVLEI